MCPPPASYSASKAALNQLARVAALEWGGGDGIRINSVHPNEVFDTGIWTEEVLTARATHYGLSVDEYKRNNVLKTEVTSWDVAELVIRMCGPAFAKPPGRKCRWTAAMIGLSEYFVQTPRSISLLLPTCGRPTLAECYFPKHGRYTICPLEGFFALRI